MSAACFSAAGLSASAEPAVASAATALRSADAALALPATDGRMGALGAALMQRWAPSFVQVTSKQHPERDRPLPIDFDGDWIATNNWSHLGPQHGGVVPTVYGSAVLTRTHAYLTYTLFYPRDWALPLCVPYVCHDNDLEVAEVVVRLGASAGDPLDNSVENSSLVFVETKAHTQYVARPAEEIEVDAEGRPFLRVETQGHGMYPARRGELAALAGEPRFVVQPAGPRPSTALAAGAEPASGIERYALVSLRDTLWARRGAATGSGLWASGDAGAHEYSGERFGRHGLSFGVLMANVHYPGGVRPPWSLHAAAGARSDWFLDPAYVASQQHPHWMLPEQTSLHYVENPFILDLAAECSGAACPSVPRAAPPTHTASLAGGALSLLAWLALRLRRRAAGRGSSVRAFSGATSASQGRLSSSGRGLTG